MTNRQEFKDKEIVWFYGIVLGMLSITFLLIATDHELPLSSVPLIFGIGFAYLGWPLKAQIVDAETVVFKGLFRKVKLTPRSVMSVRVVGVHDYRSHIVLRTKNQIPVGYRCRQYENAPILAQAVLDIVKDASKVKVQPNALKLLRQIANGKTTPLSDMSPTDT